MQIDLITQSFFEEKTEIKKETITTQRNQMILVVEGSYFFLPEGAEKPHVAGKSEIIFIPAGTTCTRRILSPTTYYYFSFSAEADHPFLRSLPMGKLVLPVEQTATLFRSVKRAFLMPNNHEMITHLLEHIMAEHYLFGKTDKVKFPTLSDEVLAAISYMNKNLDKRIDMDALAAHVYLSHTGLIWKFRQELGTTPSKYLILLRLRYAKQLLLDHDYTVTEIAELCGYSNPYYFTNAFHRYAGLSPTEFRRHYREKAVRRD